MSRMNWDRVRTETLARRHGSEWVSPLGDSGAGKRKSSATKKKKKNKKKLRRRVAIKLGPRIPGCTCDKRVGFSGQHRKLCPLCRPASSPSRSGEKVRAVSVSA